MSKYAEIRKLDSLGAVAVLIPEGKDAEWLKVQISKYASRWQIAVTMKVYEGAVVVTPRERKHPSRVDLRNMEPGESIHMEFGDDFKPAIFRNEISRKTSGWGKYKTSIQRLTGGYIVRVLREE